MFPSQPSSLGGKRTTLLHSRPNLGAFPAASTTNHIVSRNSIDSLSGGSQSSLNHAIATRTLPKPGHPLPKKITLNNEPYRKTHSMPNVPGYNQEQSQNYNMSNMNMNNMSSMNNMSGMSNMGGMNNMSGMSNMSNMSNMGSMGNNSSRERKYIHNNSDQFMRSEPGQFSQRDVPFSSTQNQPSHQYQHQQPSFNQPSQPPYQSGNGNYAGQMGSGASQSRYPGQQFSGNEEQYDGDPFEDVEEPAVYYEAEEEISSTAAPSYNPGYIVKEPAPAPFQSFPQQHHGGGSPGHHDHSDHHSRDRRREDHHHDRYPDERRYLEERAGHHNMTPPDHHSRGGQYDGRSGQYDGRSGQYESRGGQYESRKEHHYDDRHYGHHEERSRHHHSDRYTDDRHRRRSEERSRGHHGEERSRKGHSSRYPEESERYREERSRGDHVDRSRGYQGEMRESSPAAGSTGSPSTAAVQNILTSIKGLGGITNPLLNKQNTEESDPSSVQVSELLRNHIREVAKQLIEENGLSGTLDALGKKEKKKSVSPLKITTTMKRPDSSRRSRSSSPKGRSSKDRRRSRSPDRRSSRYSKRSRRSRERESRREKKVEPDLESDTIKRLMVKNYPQLAATLEAGEKIIEEHHSTPIETVQSGQVPVSIPTGALPPPAGALPPPTGVLPPPTGALPPPPFISYGGVQHVPYQQYSYPTVTPQYTLPPIPPAVPTVPRGIVSGYNPLLDTAGMLPPPITTTPDTTKLLTGPMPNKEKKTGVDQGNLLRCTPCNLNFKTKKDELPPPPQSGSLSPVEISITTPTPTKSEPPTLPSTKEELERVTKPGHVWVNTTTGMTEIKESELEVLVNLRGIDLQENVAGIKRTVDILQFKWNFEVTSLESGWDDITNNVEESLEMLKTLHKKTWKDCEAFLLKKGVSSDCILVREKELWDIFQPIGDGLNAVSSTMLAQTRPIPPANPSFRWVIENQRNEILQHIYPLQDLAYQNPPDKFKYLDKWGDDLQNLRLVMRKSIDVAQDLLGSNFEGSATWEEIQTLVQACLDTLDALKNMCFEESGAYMKKEKLQKDLVNRRVQIGNCFNQTRTDLVHFKEFAKEKMSANSPFVHLHLLEYRRQKLIDLIQNIASL